MDMLEKLNRSFGTWYEGLFGGDDDVRPKDILRRIFQAMEDNRKEGFDNRVYVPNQYVLEINVEDEEEREYLLSFLDRAELEAAIRRYCQQHHYHIRGTLEFTIQESEAPLAGTRRGEKVRIKCRYNARNAATPTPNAPEPVAPVPAAMPAGALPAEERTVAALRPLDDGSEEMGTVASLAYGTLVVHPLERAPYRFTLTKTAVAIGRSLRADNDIVIDNDIQVSKRHARLERDADGRFTLYDLGSTNGTQVNGQRIDNRTLQHGDEIVIGATRLVFEQSGVESVRGNAKPVGNPVATPLEKAMASPEAGHSHGAYGGAVAELQRQGESGNGSGSIVPSRPLRARTARLVLLEGAQEVDDYLLASETLLGRGVTNDIVLSDRSVAMRHARICHDGANYTVEVLAEGVTTLLNDLPLTLRRPEPLRDGDRLQVGDLMLRFVGDID